MSLNDPIFIYGAPRSGTSLLQSILARHPQIASPRETAFFHLLASASKKISRDPYKLWGYYKTHRRFLYQGISAEEVERNFPSKVTNRDIFDTLMNRIAARERKSRWLEKSPSHELWHSTIRAWYPKAKYLGIARDPRAVAFSLSNTPWGTNDPYVVSKIWNRSVGILLELQGAGQLKLIRYEDLVQDPEAVVRGILSYVGLEYDPDVIMPEQGLPEKQKPPVDSWLESHEKTSSSSISSKSVAKWSDRLPSRAIKTVELFCRESMRRLRYSFKYDQEVYLKRKLIGAFTLFRFYWQGSYRKSSAFRNRYIGK